MIIEYHWWWWCMMPLGGPWWLEILNDRFGAWWCLQCPTNVFWWFIFVANASMLHHGHCLRMGTEGRCLVTVTDGFWLKILQWIMLNGRDWWLVDDVDGLMGSACKFPSDLPCATLGALWDDLHFSVCRDIKGARGDCWSLLSASPFISIGASTAQSRMSPATSGKRCSEANVKVPIFWRPQRTQEKWIMKHHETSWDIMKHQHSNAHSIGIASGHTLYQDQHEWHSRAQAEEPMLEPGGGACCSTCCTKQERLGLTSDERHLKWHNTSNESVMIYHYPQGQGSIAEKTHPATHIFI